MKTKSILTLFLSLGLCAGAANAKDKEHSHQRDTNGDGILSLDEFMANRKNPEKAKARFEKADANHDGQVDKAERAAIKKQRMNRGGKKHRGGQKKGAERKNRDG